MGPQAWAHTVWHVMQHHTSPRMTTQVATTLGEVTGELVEKQRKAAQVSVELSNAQVGR